jgi:serine phosphatase RsbU (regulator of sigma subunit)
MFGQGQTLSSLTIEQCLKVAEERQQAGNIRDATFYLNAVADKYWDAKDYSNAVKYFLQSIELNKTIPNLNGIAGINSNLGTIYFDMDELEKSLDHFQQTYTYRKQQGEKHSVVSALINMSTTLNKMEQYDKSIKALEEAIEIAREINDFEQLRSCYTLLSETHTKAGNTEKAAEFYIWVKKLHEDLLKDTEKRYKAELTEAASKAQLAEMERELAEARRRIADSERAEMSKALEGLDATNRELLESKTKAELIIENLRDKEKISELEKKGIEMRLKSEQVKSRILFLGLCAAFIVVIVIGYFLWQKKRDNRKLAQQRDKIAEQRKEIMDSIYYAQYIQSAVMPDPSLQQEIISDQFMFFRPRNIVSGDFYWATRIGNKSVVVAADCTGHGVPGAFLSMLGVSFLNQIVLKLGIEIASEIIDELRNNIKNIMSRPGAYGEHRDGMDVALCIIDYDTMKLQYSGAYNPLYIVRNGELIEYSADKMPVGIHMFIDEKKFTNHEITLQHDDMVYIFTDGYIDQFGGERDTKFKSRPFKQMLTKMSVLPVEQQRDLLVETHDRWKGNGEQVDDILVMGIRIQ